MIIKIENSENFIHLFDDERTPNVSLVSVEARQRQMFGLTEIRIPKDVARLHINNDTVYLVDRPDLYQLDHEEIGYSSQENLVTDVTSILNDTSGNTVANLDFSSDDFDEVEGLLSCILEELQLNNKLLKKMVE